MISRSSSRSFIVALEARELGIGEVERDADHRLAVGTAPLVGQVAGRAELVEALLLELAVELLDEALDRRALESQSELAGCACRAARGHRGRLLELGHVAADRSRSTSRPGKTTARADPKEGLAPPEARSRLGVRGSLPARVEFRFRSPRAPQRSRPPRQGVVREAHPGSGRPRFSPWASAPPPCPPPRPPPMVADRAHSEVGFNIRHFFNKVHGGSTTTPIQPRLRSGQPRRVHGRGRDPRQQHRHRLPEPGPRAPRPGLLLVRKVSDRHLQERQGGRRQGREPLPGPSATSRSATSRSRSRSTSSTWAPARSGARDRPGSRRGSWPGPRSTARSTASSGTERSTRAA